MRVHAALLRKPAGFTVGCSMWKATGTVTLPGFISGWVLIRPLAGELGSWAGSSVFAPVERAADDEVCRHGAAAAALPAPERATVAEASGARPPTRKAPAAVATRSERICKRMTGHAFSRRRGW